MRRVRDFREGKIIPNTAVSDHLAGWLYDRQHASWEFLGWMFEVRGPETTYRPWETQASTS